MRIQPVMDKTQATLTLDEERCSFLYYIPDERCGNEEFIYFDSTKDDVTRMAGAQINKDHMFFWNKNTIWRINLFTQDMERLGIEIHPSADSEIRRVRCGSNPNTVGIRVSQSEEEDKIIVWDLTNDVQTDAFDVSIDAMTFQDESGNMFIVDGDRITNC